MTKKDFILVATVLKHSLNYTDWHMVKQLAEDLSKEFEAAYPRFNRKKFIAAILSE